jgi:hypothetical protein
MDKRRPGKPRLWRWHGWWVCGFGIALAKGSTPAEAYRNWAREVGFVPQAIR